MSANQISEFVQHLRTSILRRDGAGLTDGQLLECFTNRRDEAAMEALVRRHGPMVWGVCRRLLNHHDAEDAFQATFLVLVRKAGSIVPREMVANWLYGVAHQTALKARGTVAKRKIRERQVADMPEPIARSPSQGAAMETDVWGDLQLLLDQELSRLPDKYRVVVVLCDLDGKTRKEAARQLGLPEGTVASRLMRARTMLAKRLSRRGVVISGGVLAAMLSQNATASVPTAALASTIKAATLLATGGAATSVISAKVIALTEGVLRTMLLTKLKITTTALMMLALGCYGFTVLVRLASASSEAGILIAKGPQVVQGDQTDSSKPNHQKKPAAGRLLVYKDTKYLLMTPDGKPVGEFPNHLDGRILSDPVLSPDGKRVAFALNENPPTDEDGNRRRQVFLRAVEGQDEGFKVPLNALTFAWTPDSKGLIAVELLWAKEIKDRGLATWLVDMETKKQTRLELSRWTHPFAITPDGKSFVAALYDLEARKIHLALVSRDGKDVTKLTELQNTNEGPEPKPSPDGTQILFQDYDPADKAEKDVPRFFRLFVYDLRAKKRERLAGVPLNASIESFCWSPDGKRLAYTWKQAKPGVPLAENTNNMNDPKLNTETESFLVIADADGGNAKTILSGKSPRSTTITIGQMDWR